MNSLSLEKVNKAMKRAAVNSLPKKLCAADVIFDHTNSLLTIRLKNGQLFSYNIQQFSRLASATPKQLDNYILVGGGAAIHWETLDEDLSVKELLKQHFRKNRLLLSRNQPYFS